MRLTGPSLFIAWLLVMFLWIGAPLILTAFETDLSPWLFWIPCAVMTFAVIFMASRRGFRGMLVPPTGCAKCHYDLLGIESDKCPECVTAITRFP